MRLSLCNLSHHARGLCMPVSVFVGVCQFVEVNGSCFSLSLFVSSISYNLNQLLKSMLPLKFLSVGFIWVIRGINRFES